jgi:Tfp pilus assembly protein PilO
MNLANIQLDKQKKILIVIFFALIVYVDMGFILKAQMAGLNSLKPKIARLKNDLTTLNRDLENMRVIKNKQNQDAQKAVIKSSKVLTESQVSELLQEISSEANKFDIKIVQIRPSREIQTAKPVIPGDKFTAFLINLDLICDYHNLGKFINELENSLVFMGMQELKITTQLPDYMKQRVKLVLKTYVTK